MIIKRLINYAATTVDVRFDAIDYGSLAQAGTSETPVSRVQKNEIKVGSSDVDINIPEVRTNNDKTFAVIISNENYTMVSKVPMALNDGETFSRYCEKTLGMPKDNIRFYPGMPLTEPCYVPCVTSRIYPTLTPDKSR